MIDSHCHLADQRFAGDVSDVVARARDAGVATFLCIADSFAEGEECIAIAERFDGMFCSVGVHPHHAKDWKEGDAERLKAQATSSPKVRAIGEIGLDYHYDFSPRDAQQIAFASQVRLARELRLPCIMHNRESMPDLRAIVEREAPEKFVLHCCTEAFADAEWILDRGGLLSFTGIATYANAEEIRETIRRCPLDRMMLETDAPYLAPVPHRGKRNEPAFVVEVAKLVAELKGVSLREVDRVTTENAVEFFGLAL